MKKKSNKAMRAILTVLGIVVVAGLCTGYYFLKSSMLKGDETRYIYIEDGDDLETLYSKLDTISKPHAMKGFKFLAGAKSLGSSLKKGRYALDSKTGAWDFLNTLKRGEQTPLNVPIPSARTLDMTGLAQKGGAVVSDVRVARTPMEQPPKIGAGDCICGGIPRPHEKGKRQILER